MADQLLAVPIDQVMQRHVITIDPQERLQKAAITMLERGVRHLPVVDDRGGLVGMLSERDLRARLGDDLKDWYRHPREVEDVVANAMTPDPMTLSAGVPLEKALAVFEDERFGCIPIVDDEERLVGVLSHVDLLGWFQRHLSHQGPRTRSSFRLLPPSEHAENTAELTGHDASPAEATVGSLEPADPHEADAAPGVPDVEEEPAPWDVIPDHVESPDRDEEEDVTTAKPYEPEQPGA
jgi:CBS domain-containing protein